MSDMPLKGFTPNEFRAVEYGSLTASNKSRIDDR